MRCAIMLLTACSVAACGSHAPDTGVSPTSTLIVSGLAETAPIGNAAISCSTEDPIWITAHYTTDDGALKGEWTPVLNVETYQIEITYSRDGIQPWRVVSTFYTNRSEFRYIDHEQGGRYLVRVRVKNPCDVYGAWSSQLRIIIGAGGDDPQPPPQQEYID
jgi:hypothetical protein